MLPWTVMIVFFGTTLSNIHDAVNGKFESGPIGLAVLVVGSIIALVASILLSIVVKRHFDNMLKEAGGDIENGNPQAGPDKIEIVENKTQEHEKPDESSHPFEHNRA